MTSTFRLLDARTGWDARPGAGLDGVTVADGALVLADRAQGDPGRLPDLLAWSCEEGIWWLGGPFGLRRLGPCDEQFVPTPASRPVRAVAAGHGVVAALLDNGRGTVLIVAAATGYLHGEADIPGAVAVSVDGGQVVVSDRLGRLTRLDRSGLVCGTDERCRPADRALPRPVVPGVRAGRSGEGFCLPDRGCFDWAGLPGDGPGTPPPERVATGEYRCLPLDSGIPGCRWHRVRVDADVPPGTAVQVAVATTDGPPEDHVPHPDDWFDAGAGADALLRTPPGRWAFVRVRLTGTGPDSPAVHGIRLDLPRRTGVDDLPAVYSEDPRARDFAERFVGLFDAWLEGVDDVLDRRGSLLDEAALPDDALGWLGGLIGLGFEAEMTAERRRRLLAAAPQLYRRRGTPDGLLDTLRIALGISATVAELGSQRPWGAVGAARLGGVRLFSRSSARFRLGASRLGRAPMVGEGDPDLDAVRAGAHRIRVHLPPRTDDGAAVDPALAGRVVRSQSPAHLVTTVVPARPGFTAGQVRVGVDTVLTVPAPAMLGPAEPAGSARTVLRRRGVLASGKRRGLPSLVGAAVVGRTEPGSGTRRCAGEPPGTHEEGQAGP